MKFSGPCWMGWMGWMAAIVVAVCVSPASADDMSFSMEETGQAKKAKEGKPSKTLAEGLRFYQVGEYEQAAMALAKVANGKSQDPKGNRQKAEFFLGKSLHHLRYYQTALTVFDDISAKGLAHNYFGQTLQWLAQLGSQLPESAGIVEKVGRYGVGALDEFKKPATANLYNQLLYMMGRNLYDQGEFQRAIDLFQDVDSKSPHHVYARFFEGISFVRMRKARPAIASFRAIINSLKEGKAKGVQDEGRMRNLAWISLARVYYTAAHKRNGQTGTTDVDGTLLGQSVEAWTQVEQSSEYWLDAMFESSWAFFLADEYSRALGNVHTLYSPFFEDAYYPEALVLKAVTFFVNCQVDNAEATVTQFHERYDPVKKELDAILAKNQDNAQFFDFLQSVREDRGDLSPRVRGIVATAMSDRTVLRNLEYVALLDTEEKRLNDSSKAFQDSSIGDKILQDVAVAKAFAVDQAGDLARGRYQRLIRELQELRNQVDTVELEIATFQPRSNRSRSPTADDGSGRIQRRRCRGRRGTFALALRRRVLARRARILSSAGNQSVRKVKMNRLQTLGVASIVGLFSATSAYAAPEPAEPLMCIPDSARRNVEQCPSGAKKAKARAGNVPLSRLQETKPKKSHSGTGPTGPSLQIDMSTRMGRESVRARAENLLTREIVLLKRLVGNTSADAPRRPEILLRLAETQFEMQQAQTAKVRSYDEPIYQDCTRTPNKAKCAQQRNAQKQAKKNLDQTRKETIKTYATLVRDHPDFKRMDEVLFSLAFGLDELKQFDQSRKVYYRLIKGFPKSRFIPHAYLSFAEYYFAQSDMRSALQFYKKVTNFPPKRNSVYGYALYKMGWVQYNLENYRGALKAFVKVLEFAKANPSATDAKNLARQVRKELVIPYSRVGTPSKALSFFRRYAKNDAEAHEMLENLAELYFDTGQWSRAITTYHKLMADAPKSSKLCSWQGKVTQAVISSKPKGDQVTELKRMVDVYRYGVQAKGEPRTRPMQNRNRDSTCMALDRLA